MSHQPVTPRPSQPGLVLSRKKGQAVILEVAGHRIRVLVHEIQGPKVRLHIHAPQEVRIHREEVQALVDAGFAREKTP